MKIVGIDGGSPNRVYSFERSEKKLIMQL